MAITLRTAARTARMAALVTDLGASATAKFYNGAKPASLGVPAGTLLATLTFGATAVTDANGGTAGSNTSGVLTFGGFTQDSTSHVSGAPTFVRLSKSDGTAVVDVDIGSGSANIAFTGSIATSQSITGSLTMTDGNA